VKFIAKILIFFFLVAQSAPTLISMLDFEEEISLSIIEENEKSKEEKENKTLFLVSEPKSNFFFSEKVSNKIPSNYLISDYKIFTSTDIIPPKV
jgi:hypothetical protein